MISFLCFYFMYQTVYGVTSYKKLSHILTSKCSNFRICSPLIRANLGSQSSELIEKFSNLADWSATSSAFLTTVEILVGSLNLTVHKADALSLLYHNIYYLPLFAFHPWLLQLKSVRLGKKSSSTNFSSYTCISQDVACSKEN